MQQYFQKLGVTPKDMLANARIVQSVVDLGVKAGIFESAQVVAGYSIPADLLVQFFKDVQADQVKAIAARQEAERIEAAKADATA